MRIGLLTAVILLLFQRNDCLAQSDSLQSRIILIGDAGELTNGHHPVVAAVRKNVILDKKTTIIFLGDNLYKTGLPDEGTNNYNKIKAPLDSQLVIAKGTDAQVYFVPGNHDWNDGNPGGLEAIQREQNYVDALGDKNIHYFPKDGCAGPVTVEVTPDVILLLMDSQWWVHPFEKPGIESDCPYKTEEEVLTQIKDVLSKNSKKLIIFAFHHTIRSYGIHGGYFTWKQSLFPLTDITTKWFKYIPFPVIGFAYPITRSWFGTSEDLAHPAYAHMIAQINSVTKGFQNVIFASGHDHTLQLIKDTGSYFIVSGTGSKANRVSNGKKSLFHSDLHGFAELEISKNKNVNVAFYTIDSSSIKKAFSKNILNFAAPLESSDSGRVIPEMSFKDSVVVAASNFYTKASSFKRFFIGNNYRAEWSTPVQLKVFNLRKENGGFKVVSLGGGKQTKSLRLADKNGREWVLRTVDKDPENELPQALRGTIAQKIAQELISANNPYAALVIPTLAQATGIKEAQPRYFYVPDDPAFGIYRKIFAEKVCLLEERAPTLDEFKTKSTAKIINSIIADQDKHADQQAYLRARLLDMVIGDWDRHFDQWRWGTTDTGVGKLYYPVPRDRDHAFFKSDGFFIKLVSKNLLRYLEGFNNTINNVNWFNYEARDIDRIFMTTLDRDAWAKAIDTFQFKLTDNVIDTAISKLPPEIYPLDAVAIRAKLISRRNELKTQGLKYYDFLSRRIKITGSNESDYFNIKNNGDKLQVTVYKKNENGDSAVLYNRNFDQKVTKEIALYGLNGDDKFNINPGTTSKIKIRMIGGKGIDSFNIMGKVRNFIYDQSTSPNAILHRSKTKLVLTSNPQVNEYKTSDFIYNQYRFPQVNIGYNIEDKLLLGIGFSAKKYAFRKEPSSDQKLSTLYSPSNDAYQLKYLGIFNQLVLGKDLIVHAEFVNPTLNNFFGFGNESIKDNAKPIAYNRVRYSYLTTDVLLRKKLLHNIVQVSFGPSYYHYANKYNDNKTRILSFPTSFGSDSSSVFTNKDYVGAKVKMDVIFLNSEFFPSRGVTWLNEFSSMYGVTGGSKNLTKVTSDLTIYGSLTEERKFFGVLRLGGGHIFSKTFDYFQSLNMGMNNYNRGFRKNRFSGRSLAYGSVELRKKLFKSQSYIVPGDVGLIGFYDAGRVWMDNETSHKIHQSYGGGFYYAPFNILLISATLGVSDEDKLFNFSIGTKFHLTF